jgi:ATP-dependent RNA helicase DDX5/DBP2
MLRLEVHRRLLRLSSRRLTQFFSTNSVNQQPELAEYLKLHDISVRGAKGEVYPPMTSFENTPFPPTIINALYSEGFTAPTPIQAQSWPIALAGKDMVSVARTGSGKTCAFLLPGFLKALSNKDTPPMGGMGRRGKLPQTLVLAPTRELTQQIVDEANKFSRSSGLIVAPFYGGTPKGPQLRQLSRGVDIVVGTPGRCNDLLEMGALDLSTINYLVLDEADRMLDMGFEPQIRTLINRCNTNRQNLFFTATWPKDIAQLAADYLTNPVSVHIGGADTLNANKAIQQTIHVMKEFEKSYRLEELMETLIPPAAAATAGEGTDSVGSGMIAATTTTMSIAQRRRAAPKTLIFIARKLECDDLAYELRDLGYLVGTLHGDKEQTARTKIMNKFRTGEIRVLVATDVAARGIDIKDIEVVINYDFPSGKTSGVEDYVHRIGMSS